MKKSAKKEAKRKTFKSKHNQENTPPKKTRMRESKMKDVERHGTF